MSTTATAATTTYSMNVVPASERDIERILIMKRFKSITSLLEIGQLQQVDGSGIEDDKEESGQDQYSDRKQHRHRGALSGFDQPKTPSLAHRGSLCPQSFE